MHRRDLLATLLALLPVSAARSLSEAIAGAVADAVADHGDGNGDETDATEDGDEADGTEPASRTAVVDRIEGGVAVLLFEDGSGTKPVPAAVLPDAAREAGIVLRVPRADSLALATVDRAATARRRRAAADRFDDLAEPVPDSEAPGNATAT